MARRPPLNAFPYELSMADGSSGSSGSSGSIGTSRIPVVPGLPALQTAFSPNGAAYPHSKWSEVRMLVRCRADHTPICASKLQKAGQSSKQKSTTLHKSRVGKEQCKNSGLSSCARQISL